MQKDVPRQDTPFRTLEEVPGMGGVWKVQVPGDTAPVTATMTPQAPAAAMMTLALRMSAPPVTPGNLPG